MVPAQATEAILVTAEGLDGTDADDQFDPDVQARVAAGGVPPSDPVVPSPAAMQVI
ncbi:MAG TPA: hypothetical protein VGY51_00705 [Acidimicrobiales bacterium]|nr:hypothetical protein [Acidimicrobiales bacterium]